MDSDDLCCCEYISENGERSHLLTAVCNCNAIDEVFERLVSSQGMRPGLCAEVINTVEDRLRIPWPGGAKNIHLAVVLPLILNPLLIWLGTVNFITTLVTYLFVLPLVVILCHKYFKKKRNIGYSGTFHLKSSNDIYFYPLWLSSTVIYLLIIYYTQVISALKISSSENLTFLILFVSSCTCLYITIKKGQLELLSRMKIPCPSNSDPQKYCSECSLKVSGNAAHCKICATCFSLRDHHCLWLNICVGQINDRWFITGLILALGSVLYVVQLIFTTVCHPRIIRVAFLEVMYPHECPDAYFDFSHSLMCSTGGYAIILTVYLVLILLQQLYSISFGLRRPKHRKKYAYTCSRVVVNWSNFFTK